MKFEVKNSLSSDKKIVLEGTSILLKSGEVTVFSCPDKFKQIVIAQLCSLADEARQSKVLKAPVVEEAPIVEESPEEFIDYTAWKTADLRKKYTEVSGKSSSGVRRADLVKYLEENT